MTILFSGTLSPSHEYAAAEIRTAFRCDVTLICLAVSMTTVSLVAATFSTARSLQYTFLSYLSYIHNILSCVTFMVAPLIIQQTIFHGASVFHASVFMPYNNFAHHVEVIVLSASVSVSNDLPFYGCDCVQRCHAV